MSDRIFASATTPIDSKASITVTYNAAISPSFYIYLKRRGSFASESTILGTGTGYSSGPVTAEPKNLTDINVTNSRPVRGLRVTAIVSAEGVSWENTKATFQWFRGDSTTVSDMQRITVGASSESYTPTNLDVGKYLRVVATGDSRYGFGGTAAFTFANPVVENTNIVPSYNEIYSLSPGSFPVDNECVLKNGILAIHRNRAVKLTSEGGTIREGSWKFYKSYSVSNLKHTEITSDLIEIPSGGKSYVFDGVTFTAPAHTYGKMFRLHLSSNNGATPLYEGYYITAVVEYGDTETQVVVETYATFGPFRYDEDATHCIDVKKNIYLESPVVGSTLTATVDPNVEGVDYQWFRGTTTGTMEIIPGETSSTYTPTSDDVGKLIKVTSTITAPPEKTAINLQYCTSKSGTVTFTNVAPGQYTVFGYIGENKAMEYANVDVGVFDTRVNASGDFEKHVSYTIYAPEHSSELVKVEFKELDKVEGIRYQRYSTSSSGGWEAIFCPYGNSYADPNIPGANILYNTCETELCSHIEGIALQGSNTAEDDNWLKIEEFGAKSDNRGVCITGTQFDISALKTSYTVRDADKYKYYRIQIRRTTQGNGYVNTEFMYSDMVERCRDTNAPTILLNGLSEMQLKLGETWNDPGAFAYDKEDGNLTVSICTDSAIVNPNKADTYIVKYCAVDSSGNEASVSRTVTVYNNGDNPPPPGTVDTTPPVITLNGLDTMSVPLNGVWADPGATAIDDVDGVVTVTASGTVNTGVNGTYTITYTATDSSNNTATKTRSVVVGGTFKCVVEVTTKDDNIAVNFVTVSWENADVTDEIEIGYWYYGGIGSSRIFSDNPSSDPLFNNPNLTWNNASESSSTISSGGQIERPPTPYMRGVIEDIDYSRRSSGSKTVRITAAGYYVFYAIGKKTRLVTANFTLKNGGNTFGGSFWPDSQSSTAVYGTALAQSGEWYSDELHDFVCYDYNNWSPSIHSESKLPVLWYVETFAESGGGGLAVPNGATNKTYTVQVSSDMASWEDYLIGDSELLMEYTCNELSGVRGIYDPKQYRYYYNSTTQECVRDSMYPEYVCTRYPYLWNDTSRIYARIKTTFVLADVAYTAYSPIARAHSLEGSNRNIWGCLSKLKGGSEVHLYSEEAFEDWVDPGIYSSDGRYESPSTGTQSGPVITTDADNCVTTKTYTRTYTPYCAYDTAVPVTRTIMVHIFNPDCWTTKIENWGSCLGTSLQYHNFKAPELSVLELEGTDWHLSMSDLYKQKQTALTNYYIVHGAYLYTASALGIITVNRTVSNLITVYEYSPGTQKINPTFGFKVDEYNKIYWLIVDYENITGDACDSQYVYEPKPLFMPVYSYDVVSETSAGITIELPTSVTGASSFNIYRAFYPYGDWSFLGTTEEDTFTDTTAVAGYTYKYGISANCTAEIQFSESYTALNGTVTAETPIADYTMAKRMLHAPETVSYTYTGLNNGSYLGRAQVSDGVESATTNTDDFVLAYSDILLNNANTATLSVNAAATIVTLGTLTMSGDETYEALAFSIATQADSSNVAVNYFSIDNDTLKLAAATPTGVYTVTVVAEDGETALTSKAYTLNVVDTTIALKRNLNGYTLLLSNYPSNVITTSSYASVSSLFKNTTTNEVIAYSKQLTPSVALSSFTIDPTNSIALVSNDISGVQSSYVRVYNGGVTAAEQTIVNPYYNSVGFTMSFNTTILAGNVGNIYTSRETSNGWENVNILGATVPASGTLSVYYYSTQPTVVVNGNTIPANSVGNITYDTTNQLIPLINKTLEDANTLSLNKLLYDGNSVYAVFVNTVDSTPTILGMARITAKITSPPTSITLAGATDNAKTITLVQDQSTSYNVGALTVTDPDAGDISTLTIQSQTTATAMPTTVTYFTLATNTLSMAYNTPTGAYYVKIRATDSNDLYREQTFTITVTANVIISLSGADGNYRKTIRKVLLNTADYDVGQLSVNIDTGTPFSYTLLELEE